MQYSSSSCTFYWFSLCELRKLEYLTIVNPIYVLASPRDDNSHLVRYLHTILISFINFIDNKMVRFHVLENVPLTVGIEGFIYFFGFP